MRRSRDRIYYLAGAEVNGEKEADSMATEARLCNSIAQRYQIFYAVASSAGAGAASASGSPAGAASAPSTLSGSVAPSGAGAALGSAASAFFAAFSLPAALGLAAPLPSLGLRWSVALYGSPRAGAGFAASAGAAATSALGFPRLCARGGGTAGASDRSSSGTSTPFSCKKSSSAASFFVSADAARLCFAATASAFRSASSRRSISRWSSTREPETGARVPCRVGSPTPLTEGVSSASRTTAPSASETGASSSGAAAASLSSAAGASRGAGMGGSASACCCGCSAGREPPASPSASARRSR
mmetsp:Transcript_13028/g.42957  ORF Transcript_13028/g.42957 Transcript_13028/m.42957 type:complete len:301 (+) Transcript_13028:1057-1959(+)